MRVKMPIRRGTLGAFIMAILAGVVLIAALLVTRTPQSSDRQPTRPILRRVVPPPGGGPILGEKTTLEEARSLVPFPFAEPSFLPDDARLTEVWVGPAADRSLALVYSNDILIIFHPTGGEAIPDWEAIINQPGLHFQKVTVHGVPGMGTDAGVQEIDGVEEPYPGSVDWITNGVETTLYGPYSLQTLLRIAESMP